MARDPIADAMRYAEEYGGRPYMLIIYYVSGNKDYVTPVGDPENYRLVRERRGEKRPLFPQPDNIEKVEIECV